MIDQSPEAGLRLKASSERSRVRACELGGRALEPRQSVPSPLDGVYLVEVSSIVSDRVATQELLHREGAIRFVRTLALPRFG